MAQVSILANLEYLGRYGNDEYLGATIQVASDTTPLQMGANNADTEPLRDLLRPWNWNPRAPIPVNSSSDSRMVVWLIDDKGKKIAELPLLKPSQSIPDMPTSDKNDTLVDYLDCRFENLISNAAQDLASTGQNNQFFGWAPQKSPEKMSSSSQGVANRWPAQLAQMGRYPYPIPHQLGLSYFLRMKVDPISLLASSGVGTCSLIALPTFSIGQDNYYPDPKYDASSPTPSIISIDPKDKHATVDYQVSGSTTVQVNVMPLEVAECKINAVTGKTQCSSSWSQYDPYLSLSNPEDTAWQHELVPLTGELFDMSARLVEAFRFSLTRVNASTNNGQTSPQPHAQSHANQNLQPDPYQVLQDTIAANFDSFRLDVLTAIQNLVGSLSGAIPSNAAGAAQDTLQSGGVGATQPTASATPPYVDETSLMGRIYSEWAKKQASDDSISAADRESLCENVLSKVADYVKNKMQVEPDWRSFLAKIPSLSGNSMLTDNPLPPPNLFKPNATSKEVNAELFRRLAQLEQLHQVLTQNDQLATMFTLLWDQFAGNSVDAQPLVAPTKSLNPAWNSFLTTARVELAKIDLRQQLVESNLGQSWPAILTAFFSTSAAVGCDASTTLNNQPRMLLRNSIKGVLLNQILAAGSAKTSIAQPSNPPGKADFGPALQACLFAPDFKPIIQGCVPQAKPNAKLNDIWADVQISSIVPDSASANGERKPTNVSSGITFMLDSISGNQDDANDLARSMIGLCVLARRNTANPASPPPSWLCLNLASVTLQSDPKQSFSKRAVIPIPVHDAAGIRNSTVTYNNSPLMGKSPEMEFGGSLSAVPDESNRLLAFTHPSFLASPENSDDAKIPGLVFTQDKVAAANFRYDFVVGVVRNSGALPPLFANPADPGTLAAGADPAKLTQLLSTHGGTLDYRRTVPVGSLRFGSNASTAQKLEEVNQGFAFPPIPRTVRPRALELTGEHGLDPAKSDQPLLLLSSFAGMNGVSGIKEFSFSVWKPSTDIKTWDQWVANDSRYTKEIRAAVWADYNESTYKQSFAEPVLLKKELRDTGIEDPAVDQLQLTLKELGTSNGNGPDVTKFVTWPKPSMAPGLTGQRSAPIKITIKIAEPNKTPSFEASSYANEWVLEINNGKLYQVTLAPTVSGNDKNRFASGILKTSNSYSILIETASPDLPQPADLRAALTATAKDGGDKSSLDPVGNPIASQLSFELALDASKNQAFNNIGSAQIRFQKWRWDGRPFMENIADAIPTIMSASAGIRADKASHGLLNWEKKAFGTRAVTDSSTAGTTRSADGAKLVLNEGVTSDLGLLYFRYGVIVTNRYSTLVPPEYRTCHSLGKVDDEQMWNRIAVKARWQGVIPKPAIKVVLPLTSSIDNDQKVASLLAIVQGPWYAIGGLAEEMHARLVRTVTDHPEAGPDPIRWQGNISDLEKNRDYYKLQDTADSDSKLLQPVGHTFDDTDQNPLWVNTSFVVPPIEFDAAAPANPSNANSSTTTDQADVSWAMAKIQFYRKLVSGAFAWPVSESDLLSEPTDPYWVQYLPSNDYLPVAESGKPLQRLLAKDVLLKIGQDKVVTLIDRDPSATSLVFETSGANPIQHFLLLTRQVEEMVSGRKQERFVNIRPPEAGSLKWKQDSSNPGRVVTTAMNPVGRIVEIEFLRSVSIDTSTRVITNNSSSYLSLWDALFPQPNATSPEPEPVGRIVSISPPIFTEGNSPSACKKGS